MLTPEQAAKQAQDAARTREIESQRVRAKDLLAEATSKEDVTRAVHVANAEIAAAELGDNRMDHQLPRPVDEAAHQANVDLLKAEVSNPERARLLERDKREAEQMALRNADVDFIAREAKLRRAINHLSGE